MVNSLFENYNAAGNKPAASHEPDQPNQKHIGGQKIRKLTRQETTRKYYLIYEITKFNKALPVPFFEPVTADRMLCVADFNFTGILVGIQQKCRELVEKFGFSLQQSIILNKEAMAKKTVEKKTDENFNSTKIAHLGQQVHKGVILQFDSVHKEVKDEADKRDQEMPKKGILLTHIIRLGLAHFDINEYLDNEHKKNNV